MHADHTPAPAFEQFKLPSRFDRALARYLYALDRLNTTDDQSDENCDLLTDAMMQAADDMIAEPAADLHQLRVKADVIFSDLQSIAPDRHVLALFADLRRLTGDKPSPIFSAADWLARFERRGGGWALQDDTIHLVWPETADVEDHMQELDMRGGKPAVLALIRERMALRQDGEGDAAR